MNLFMTIIIYGYGIQFILACIAIFPLFGLEDYMPSSDEISSQDKMMWCFFPILGYTDIISLIGNNISFIISKSIKKVFKKQDSVEHNDSDDTDKNSLMDKLYDINNIMFFSKRHYSYDTFKDAVRQFDSPDSYKPNSIKRAISLHNKYNNFAKVESMFLSLIDTLHGIISIYDSSENIDESVKDKIYDIISRYNKKMQSLAQEEIERIKKEKAHKIQLKNDLVKGKLDEVIKSMDILESVDN